MVAGARGKARLLAAAAATAVTAAVAVLPTGAEAARPPTFAERQAVTAALPASLRRQPVGCVWLAIQVARDRRWARVEPRYLNATRAPCVRYASNGFYLLKRAPRWHVVYNGSDPPPCALGAPRDVTACLR